jgi:mRNA interferase MazF
MAKPAEFPVTTAVAMPESMLQRVEALADVLGVTRDQLLLRAIENFIHHQPTSQTQRLVVNQGEIYWIALSDPHTGASIPHPYVVVQDNLFNHSRLETVVVCALTSNLRRISETPGNLLLDAGEANLPKQSVVEVSKVSTVAKAQLGELIGTLSGQRVAEILAGMRFLQLSAFRQSHN